MKSPALAVRPGEFPPENGDPPAAVRVAMTIDAFRPVLGGAQLQIEHLAPLLADRGVGISILTRRTDPRARRRAHEGALEVLRIPVPRDPTAASVVYTLRGAGWIVAQRPQVVHAHGLLSAATLALLGAWRGELPVVVKVLSSGPHGDLARLRAKPGGRRRWRWIRQRCAAFVCVSDEIEQDLREAGVAGSRMVRIPNGVDVLHHRPCAFDGGHRERCRALLGLPVSAPLTLTAGRLDPTKHVDQVIAAHAQVPGTLVIVGAGPERARLAATARAAGLAERVVFRDTVDDLAPYLRAADVYVTWSQQDGLSNVVLEAMATGLPVVAAPAGGMAELVDATTGILVPQTAPERLGAAVAALVRDPRRATACGAAGRRRVVQRYALATTADRLAALYRRVAA